MGHRDALINTGTETGGSFGGRPAGGDRGGTRAKQTPAGSVQVNLESARGGRDPVRSDARRPRLPRVPTMPHIPSARVLETGRLQN